MFKKYEKSYYNYNSLDIKIFIIIIKYQYFILANIVEQNIPYIYNNNNF